MPKYTKIALSEKIKQDLAKVLLDIDKYLEKINECRQNISNSEKKFYYDYDLDLDFSYYVLDRIYDDRKYYYKANHFLKIGVFKNNIPTFKVELSDLQNDTIYELSLVSIVSDRSFILKQAVAKIFEDINYELYHNSISYFLKIELV